MKIRDQQKQIVCVSFHYAKDKMQYPYALWNVEGGKTMESNTLIFSRHNTQSKITATITGFSIELHPSFRNI